MGTLSPDFVAPGNITGASDLIKYADMLSGGIWLIGLSYILWIIIFAAVAQKEGALKGYHYATWVQFFLMVFLVSGNYVINTAIVLPLIMMGVSGVLLFRYKE